MIALGKTFTAITAALVTAGAIGLGAMTAAASSDDYRYGKRYYDDDAYEYRYKRHYDRYEYGRKYYRSKCGAVRGKWMSPRKAAAKLEKKGFRVYRIKSDDGCYEAKARDRRGYRVEIYMNPVSGKIVRVKRHS